MSETPDEYLHHMVGWPFVNNDVRHVGVAVSGGGDSMALLVLMEEWAAKNGAAISAVTVDHGLRPEAAEEAAMVAKFCAGRGIAHKVRRWQGWDGKGNVQAEARAARYGLIADWAKGQGVDVVCLGHTKDDQAETFLMRLARKAGSDGLRGMLVNFEREGARWARPLLMLGREDLRGYLRRQSVEWIEDPSNEDARFDRVKARQVLAALAPLGIDADVLGAVADNLYMENSLIRMVVRDALAGQIEESMGALSISKEALDELHPEVVRRFLAGAVQWIGGADYRPRQDALITLEIAVRQNKAHTLGGVIAWGSKGRIWLARELEAVRDETGTPFDGRWQIGGLEPGQEIRALGAEGLKQMPDWRDMNLPRRVLLPLPSVWDGEKLVSVPLIHKGNSHKATDLRPSFDKWLMQH